MYSKKILILIQVINIIQLIDIYVAKDIGKKVVVSGINLSRKIKIDVDMSISI